jgi:hypothetical protein
MHYGSKAKRKAHNAWRLILGAGFKNYQQVGKTKKSAYSLF